MNLQILLSAVLQGMAALLQLTTAILAMRLNRITGRAIAWLVISVALGIMAVRRGYSLWVFLEIGKTKPLLFDELFALAISLLMLVGVIAITPFFQALKQSQKNLRQTGRTLVSEVVASTAQLRSAKEQLEAELLERRRAEAALAAEHQRVYALLDALPALVYLKAPDHTIRFANRRFREDLGNPNGQHCYEFFGSKGVCSHCVSLEVLETGAPLKEEWVRPQGGRIYEFIHYPFSDLDGSPLVLTLGIDITERKQIEEALRESEEKYRLLVSQLPAMVFRGYADWSVDFFDNKIETLTGYSKEDFDLRRLKWCDVILPEDLDYAAQVFTDALKSDLSYMREHRIRRKDGEIRWVQCWGQIFLDKAGKIAYISGVTFDVTARKQLEDNLRQSEASLHHLASELLTIQEQERTRIAQGLHDELGQSLIILKMKLRSLKRQVQGKDQALEGHCREMLEDLDEIAENVRRISRGLSPYILSGLGLEAALQRLLEEFSSQSRITLDLNGDFTGLNQSFPASEQIHIYRIFQECLTNIGKHSGASALEITINRNGSEVSFLVADNGRGFNLEKVQDSAASGKGIGLTTLEERARLLGGGLTIASAPGQGTRIKVLLPLNRNMQV